MGATCCPTALGWTLPIACTTASIRPLTASVSQTGPLSAPLMPPPSLPSSVKRRCARRRPPRGAFSSLQPSSGLPRSMRRWSVVAARVWPSWRSGCFRILRHSSISIPLPHRPSPFRRTTPTSSTQSTSGGPRRCSFRSRRPIWPSMSTSHPRSQRNWQQGSPRARTTPSPSTPTRVRATRSRHLLLSSTARRTPSRCTTTTTPGQCSRSLSIPRPNAGATP